MEKQYKIKITGGRSYNYLFDNNHVTIKEGSYRLELQNI